MDNSANKEPFLAGADKLDVSISRVVRRLVCRLLIGVFALSQFALAAHALPIAADALSAVASWTFGAGAMPSGQCAGEPAASAHDSGPQLSGSCVAHCQTGLQPSGGAGTLLPSAPGLPTSVYPLDPLDARAACFVELAALDLPPPTGPPHAILNCCWRY